MGATDRRGRVRPIHFGMHVVDANDQVMGTVVLVRDTDFVIRQELGINQLVALSMMAISGVVGGLVFLNVTCGEIELYGKTLERRERSSGGPALKSRVAFRTGLVPEAI
ncbi:MAG TPA: hypothetical protein VFB34_11160 [Chloroflexota bacterium]|nr:hypothetical protein [Chloroflexota bacterium]